MLTPQLIDNFPYYQVTDYKTIQRGRQYYLRERVFDIDYQEKRAICQVDGNHDVYEVTISLASKNNIHLSCTCPQGNVTHQNGYSGTYSVTSTTVVGYISGIRI